MNGEESSPSEQEKIIRSGGRGAGSPITMIALGDAFLTALLWAAAVRAGYISVSDGASFLVLCCSDGWDAPFVHRLARVLSCETNMRDDLRTRFGIVIPDISKDLLEQSDLRQKVLQCIIPSMRAIGDERTVMTGCSTAPRLIGEAYYEAHQSGARLWAWDAALRLCREAFVLRRALGCTTTSTDAFKLERLAFKLMAVPISCPELWKRRQRVGKICGLDLSEFNELAPQGRCAVDGCCAVDMSGWLADAGTSVEALEHGPVRWAVENGALARKVVDRGFL